jgi:NhaA family Na+:H+ antiporter
MAKSMLNRPNPFLPQSPIRRWTRPLVKFLEIESASGIVLLLCTLVALVLANTKFAEDYQALWHTYIGFEFGGFKLGGEFGHFFINDVLMTIFFFVVGLEIKRELVAGELRDPRKAALPVAAAVGGMLVPAAIYVALMSSQIGQAELRGWGVPMATDIAFVVGVMALLGKRFPFSLKIMILSLAIADDIGAVIVIAVFYSGGLNWLALGLAAGGFALVYLLNRVGVRAVPTYVVVGVFIWLAVYKSGVHPTVAGVLLGLLTPSSAWIGDKTLIEVLQDALENVPGVGSDRYDRLQQVQFTAREGVSPLERLEVGLHPWVAFVIMPLFALANAGVHIEMSELTSPIARSVALGLMIGKPVGIMLFSYLAVRIGIAKLPEGVNWPILLGGGCLAGIGFTMSLFVAGLAFSDHPEMLAAAKLGTLLGSALSVVVATALLLGVLRTKAPAAAPKK